jgi:hypothetical protein
MFNDDYPVGFHVHYVGVSNTELDVSCAISKAGEDSKYYWYPTDPLMTGEISFPFAQVLGMKMYRDQHSAFSGLQIRHLQTHSKIMI